MQALVLSDQPLVRIGLSMLLEQSGYTARAPSLTTIGQALELMQDFPCRFVIIDAGWCDWARLSMLTARLEPQRPRVQVAVLCHRHADPRQDHPENVAGVTVWLDQATSPDSMWADLSTLLQSGPTGQRTATLTH